MKEPGKRSVWQRNICIKHWAGHPTYYGTLKIHYPPHRKEMKSLMVSVALLDRDEIKWRCFLHTLMFQYFFMGKIYFHMCVEVLSSVSNCSQFGTIVFCYIFIYHTLLIFFEKSLRKSWFLKQNSKRYILGGNTLVISHACTILSQTILILPRYQSRWDFIMRIWSNDLWSDIHNSLFCALYSYCMSTNV